MIKNEVDQELLKPLDKKYGELTLTHVDIYTAVLLYCIRKQEKLSALSARLRIHQLHPLQMDNTSFQKSIL